MSGAKPLVGCAFIGLGVMLLDPGAHLRRFKQGHEDERERIVLTKGDNRLVLGAVDDGVFGLRLVNDRLKSIAELVLVGDRGATALRLSQANRQIDIVLATQIDRTSVGGTGSGGLLVERDGKDLGWAVGGGRCFMGASGKKEMTLFSASSSGESHVMGRVRSDGATQLRVRGTGGSEDRGKARASALAVSVGGEVGVLGTVSAHGKRRVSLLSNGLIGNTTLKFWKDEETSVLDLSANDTGQIGVTVRDLGGAIRGILGMSKKLGGAALQLRSREGKDVFTRVAK